MRRKHSFAYKISHLISEIAEPINMIEKWSSKVGKNVLFHSIHFLFTLEPFHPLLSPPIEQ